MSTSPVFHNLWPTTIMSVILPGSEMANQVLSEFINELDKRFGISGHEEKNNRNA